METIIASLIEEPIEDTTERTKKVFRQPCPLTDGEYIDKILQNKREYIDRVLAMSRNIKKQKHRKLRLVK